jgi:FkbM family methyltransferase
MRILGQLMTNLGARVALAYPPAERLLRAGLRKPRLRRRLKLGAIALGYTRVLRGRALRIAQLDGYRFWVNVAEPLGVEPYFFGRPGTAWLAPELVRPGDVCGDVGANAGHDTFLCAHSVGSRGRVISLEPNPEFASLLRASVVLNGYEDRVVVRQLALAASNGSSVAFHVSDDSNNTGTSSLVEHGWFSEGSHVIEVSTTTLDEIFAEADSERFRLVKIDVERAEDAVLVGARNVLAHQLVDYFIIELRTGTSAAKLLADAGYEGLFLDEAQQLLVPIKDIPNGQFGDYLFRLPGLPQAG